LITKLKALLTTGGHGTRLRPLTHTKNKHLIPIANKPIIHYALDYIAEAGISEVGIITKGEGLEMIEALGTGDKWGLNLTYIPQDEPKGLAHVVKISQDFIGDSPFIFYLGDNILVGGIKKFIDKFKKSKSNCHLVLSKVNDPQRFGVPEIKDNKIIGVEEKPDKPKSDFAVTGIYLYDSSIFKAVNNIKPSERGEFEISDAHQYLLENGMEISYSEITGWWKDTGKPEDLLEANRLVLEKITNVHNFGDISSDSEIVGNVSVGKNSKIKNSRIRGPVIILSYLLRSYTLLLKPTYCRVPCLARSSALLFFSLGIQETSYFLNSSKTSRTWLNKGWRFFAFTLYLPLIWFTSNSLSEYILISLKLLFKANSSPAIIAKYSASLLVFFPTDRDIFSTSLPFDFRTIPIPPLSSESLAPSIYISASAVFMSRFDIDV